MPEVQEIIKIYGKEYKEKHKLFKTRKARFLWRTRIFKNKIKL